MFKDAVSGLQILFVAFGAMVLVPLLTGLNPAMALLGAGVSTIIFQIVTNFKVPIFLGSSFAFITPIIYSIQTWGLGSTMFALFCTGFVYFLFSLIIKIKGENLIQKLFPPVVIGPVITVIGLSVAVSASSMAMGKSGATQVMPQTQALLLASFSFAITIIIAIFGSKILKLVPILIGAVCGYFLALFLGLVDTSAIAAAPWFAIPEFKSISVNFSAAIFMIPVAIAPIIEHIGAVMAVGGVTNKDYTKDPGLHKTLAGDGVGVCFAGLIGGPPVTTYSEVTGAIMITKNAQVKIMTWAAIFAILLAFVGKFNAILSSIPLPVMGGVMILLFGTIASLGIKTLIDAKVDLSNNKNLVIISVTLITGVGGLVADFGAISFAGVGLSALLAIILNLLLPNKN
ncbi:uracil-xanthine permease family protein [Campylobacter canadensis]|uniref:Uracil-xanthine permease n=1 Tax=Campylobacter canadensis TaxID=449520 RepID=A0ABS7WSQ9_9BACT|nr:uracil-xanthine permease family protein [Campylobacter canadensis]MBZ7987797.1 uracil-xanthine permease [Campylobacter canadensis]MBZ7995313.1 uracil-xanthine permease [Campylobacter canadensis]MBZ7997013.1 uracil-xanthine permease [Campylobacter canadensis]MBZ7999138.1 uracil-xanthine permease [Campylobacter canadensis]MBZ8000669.1 uracil-xanthine permease [Campylobacter canadensis]